MPGIIEDLVCQAFFNNLTSIHDTDTISYMGDNTEIMCDVQNGHIQFFLQVTNQFKDLSLNGHVQSSCRFVTDEYFRLSGNRNGDDYALPHTAGKFMRQLTVTPLHVVNSNSLQKSQAFFLRSQAMFSLMQTDRFFDLFADAHEGIK